MPTQAERILDALHYGPVAATDFSAPRVLDGLDPIFRVAARIGELRADGHHITTRRLPNGVAVYQLDGQPTAGERPAGASPTVPAVDRPCAPADRSADRPLPVGAALFNPDQYGTTPHYRETAA